MTNPLLTYAAAGQQLGLSARSIQRLVQSGKLRAVRIMPRSPRIAAADLDKFIADNE